MGISGDLSFAAMQTLQKFKKDIKDQVVADNGLAWVVAKPNLLRDDPADLAEM